MNFRLLLSIALITVLTACGGAEERKAVYMEKANSSIEAGDLDKARIELKNVLQIDPKDGEAYFKLGKVFEQQQEYRKAYGNYLKAEELSPELLENHARLGRFYLLLMKDKVKTQEKVDLILSKEPDNSDGLMLKAALMIQDKDKAGAITIAKDVVVRDPGYVEGAIFLATLYVKDKNNEEAISLLDSALKDKPDNESLNKLLAAILVQDKQYERAEGLYKDFLERNPDVSASYNNLAAFYNKTDNKEKAEAILRASIENDPDNVKRQLTFIRYIKESKSNDEAIAETKKLIANNDALGELRTALADLYILSNDSVSASVVLIDTIKDFSEDATGIKAPTQLAAIYISDENYSKAKQVVEEAINISPNDPKVNMLRARLALNEKDMETATISLRIVTKETPDNVDAYLLLAKIHEYEKNDEQVKSTLNTAFENNKQNADGLLKLVQAVLSSDINLAEKAIDQYNKLKENDYKGLSVKAVILNQKKEFSEAYAVSQALMELYPDQPNGYLRSMPYYIEQRDIQTAVSILEKGYINTKNDRKILTLLTTMQGSVKQFDVVENRINAELKAAPDDEELIILLYKVYMAKNDSTSAEKLLSEVVNNDTATESPYLWLAKTYQNKNDITSAKSTLMKGRVNAPGSMKIPLTLATIYEQEESYSQAIEVYRDMHQKNPDNLIVINNLVSMLSDHSDNKDDLDMAATLLEKLKESGQPVFYDTVGWLYFKQGQYQDAVKYLKQVVEKVPEINVFNYHLGMALKMSGDKEQAKIYLEKSLADKKPFKQSELAREALKDI